VWIMANMRSAREGRTQLRKLGIASIVFARSSRCGSSSFASPGARADDESLKKGGRVAGRLVGRDSRAVHERIQLATETIATDSVDPMVAGASVE